MRRILFNQEESRPRSGLRILGFLVIFWLLASAIFAVKPLFDPIGKREFISDYSLLIIAILAAAASIAVLVSRKWLDKKSVRSLGLYTDKWSPRDLIFGFALSAAMAGTFFVTLVVLGLVQYDGMNLEDFNPDAAFPALMRSTTYFSLSLLLLETILVGYWEELVFRGYLLQNMAEGMGWKLAVVVSCVLYGLIHASNPNAGLLSTAIIMCFGFLRIYGYLLTKSLWLSMGMHIGWNFFQGPIFGFAASGHQTATLIQHDVVSSSTYLTGGDFGPEASLLILPILGLALWSMKQYRGGQMARAQFATTA
jgi:membrane protease YdiL (CAAX protease family)